MEFATGLKKPTLIALCTVAPPTLTEVDPDGLELLEDIGEVITGKLMIDDGESLPIPT